MPTPKASRYQITLLPIGGGFLLGRLAAGFLSCFHRRSSSARSLRYAAKSRRAGNVERDGSATVEMVRQGEMGQSATYRSILGAATEHTTTPAIRPRAICQRACRSRADDRVVGLRPRF